jgi:hypothetical protein
MRRGLTSAMRLMLFAGLLSAEAAGARPLEAELPRDRKACWERIYDAAHLAAHPWQKVVRIKLVHMPQSWREAEGGAFYVDLKMTLRKRRPGGHAFDYSLGAVCKADGASLLCVNEWDAGSWRIERAAGGGLVVRNGGGIIMNPSPYDAEEVADGAAPVPAAPDDRAWALEPSPDAACRIE